MNTQDLFADIAAISRRFKLQYGEPVHVLKAHPMTIRDMLEELKTEMCLAPVGAQPSIYGVRLETDPAIPEGVILPFNGKGEMLLMCGGRMITVAEALSLTTDNTSPAAGR